MSTEHDPLDVPVDELSSTGDLADLAERRRRFAELTARKKALDADKRKVQRELDDLEGQVLNDYAELGTDSMRTTVDEQRFTVHLATEVFARPLKSGVNDRGDAASTDEDWAAACKALRDVGLGHMVGERFNAQSLGAWVREFRETHGPNWREQLPDETTAALDLGDRQRVRVRKA